MDRIEFKTGAELTVSARALDGEGRGVCAGEYRKNAAADIGVYGNYSAGASDGRVIFVKGLLPAERARVRLTDVRPAYATAEILEITEASGDRIEPACRYYGKCGGCAYMHVPYSRELEYKRQAIGEAFRRIAGMPGAAVKPVIGDLNGDKSDFRARYRNKGQYAFKDGKFGFYAQGSHDILEIGDCLLQKIHNRDILSVLSAWAEENPEAAAGLNNAVIRTGEATGEVVIILNYSAEGWNGANLAGRMFRESGGRGITWRVAGALGNYGGLSLRSVAVNEWRYPGGRGRRSAPRLAASFTPYGNGVFNERSGAYKFRVSHGAFMQINTIAAEKLFGVALDFAAPLPGDLALDLYCGVGTVASYIAGKAKTVVGVEISGEAVKNARENAALNGLNNLMFIEADANKIKASAYGAAKLSASAYGAAKITAPIYGAAVNAAKELRNPDIITLDPPRSGCGGALIDSIAKLGAKRVVYISCNPATLARDAALLVSKDAGYRVSAIQPVDLFPRASSVETVVLFEK